jgi:hypothetical protein
MCIAVAAAVTVTVWEFAPGGVQAEVVARYPDYAAQGVPGSAEIHVRLWGGWFNTRTNFNIMVTGSDGQIVEGRDHLDKADVLTFTPEEPLRAGTYAVAVHHRESPSSKGDVLDSWHFTVESTPSLSDGSGGSVLLVAQEGTRDSYLAEILRAEGFTGFDTVTPEQVSSDVLADHTVVILGAMSSTGRHLVDVESWVRRGGELITMKPEGRLAELAGLKPTGETIEDAYLQIDTAHPPGAGLTAERMQFHGDALLYTSGPESRTIATLSADRERSGLHPAVTLTAVGSGGHIAAFSYDLATSVMYTRQGDPAAAGTERDGVPPIRPDDLFMGPKGEPGYLDQSKIGIPQADEQMRLLSNILVELHGDTSPLPRFWYLPGGEKAALLMAGDDHGTEGGSTRHFFDRMLSLAPPGCKALHWECPRGTVWLYPSAPFTAEDAKHYSDLGFDLGAHVSTQCANWTEESLDAAFATYMLEFRSKYPDLPDQTGHRLHCIAYSDWLGLPTEEQRWGIRLDMNYYNWPPSWIGGRPGYITGSALPMRFGDDNGRILDIFQQESHLVNETWNGSTAAVEELITAAEDARGYYGVFGTHFDFSDDFEQKLMDVAVRRHIPMVSAKQLLDFTEGRQASTFTNVQQTDTGDTTFDVHVDSRADGMLQGMLPMDSGDSKLTSLTADGAPVDYDVERIKGISYAFFDVGDLHYEADYR